MFLDSAAWGAKVTANIAKYPIVKNLMRFNAEFLWTQLKMH